MKMHFSDEQTISILSEAEAGVLARPLGHKYAISDATINICRKDSGGVDSLKGNDLINVKRITSGSVTLAPGRRRFGSFCDVKNFRLITSGFSTFTMLTAGV